MKWLLSLLVLLTTHLHLHAQDCSTLIKKRTVFVQDQQYKNHTEPAPCMAHNRMLFNDNADTLQQLSDFYHSDSTAIITISKPITLTETLTQQDGNTLQRDIAIWLVREPKRLYIIGNVSHHNEEYTPHHHCYVVFHFSDGSSITYDEPMYSHYSDAEEVFVLLAGRTNPYEVGDFNYVAKGDRDLMYKLMNTPLVSITRGCGGVATQQSNITAYQPDHLYQANIKATDANTLMYSLQCITGRR